MKDKNSNSTDNATKALNVPAWVNWIAQDESGVWWGYSVEPLRNDHGWYENEVGKYIRLGMTEPVNWADSLLRMNAG